MRYLSVCSGIEAATVAWHHMGWTPVGFSEIEPFPSKVLQHHYPNIRNHGDLTKHHEWDLPEFDLLVGGTPCQAFSIAGMREGLNDPRGNLTLTFLGLAAWTRPKWILWENVPGVLSDRTNAFGCFLQGLAELGYQCSWRVLDAQFFGVPQRRRRVFLVGHIGDWRGPAKVLFEPEGVYGDPPPRRKARKDTTGSTGDGIARCLTASELKRGSDWETANYIAALSLHASGVRRITPTEAERLQGFPDGYTAIPGAEDGPRYKALGNSMAVPCMRWIGERMERA